MVQHCWFRLPETLRLLLLHLCDGVAFGCAAGLVKIFSDVGGIGTELTADWSAAASLQFFGLNFLGWGIAVAGGAGRFRCEG